MRFGLDVPTDEEFSDPRALAELAAEAEAAGWDGFFIWDTLFKPEQPTFAVADPWIALTAIALRTQSITLGIMVTPLPRHRPWLVARQAAMIDQLSGGRLILGIDLGFKEEEFTTFGEEADLRVRAAKLDEGLAILDGLWQGKPFSHNGEHYQLENALLFPMPAQKPRIPIWLGGGWPRRKPFQRAARWDGVYPLSDHQRTHQQLSPADIREMVTYIQDIRRGQGITGPFDVALAGMTPRDDPQRAAEIVSAYADAGLTWRLEYDQGSLSDYRAFVRQGPPHLAD